MTKAILTASRLRELLHYNPDTGVFTRLVRVANAIAGVAAGCRRDDGRVVISIDRKSYLSSRLAWLYVTGSMPSFEIDHKDTNPANDAWDNLRDVTPSVNQQNKRRAARNSTTGLLGVRKHRNKFMARIKIKGRTTYIGIYPTPELAYSAYLEAKRRLHPGCTI